MPAYSNFVMAKGWDTLTAITKKRFVKITATGIVAQCDTEGETVYGVSKYSVSLAEIAKGKGVSVHTDGILLVEAAEQINAGQLVATENDGRAVVADSGDYVVGMCVSPAAATGDECSVDATQGGATV